MSIAPLAVAPSVPTVAYKPGSQGNPAPEAQGHEDAQAKRHRKALAVIPKALPQPWRPPEYAGPAPGEVEDAQEVIDRTAAPKRLQPSSKWLPQPPPAQARPPAWLDESWA